MKDLNCRNFVFFLGLIFCNVLAFGQTYEMDAEDGNTIVTCSGTFTDSDPSTTGNYADNEDYTVTFCSGSGDFLTFDFDVSGFFDALGTGDTLYMYDGTSTSGDLIMKIDNTDDPAFSQFMLSTFSTCVTFHFVSNGDGNTNDGWAAIISCPSPPAPCNNNQVAADIQLQAPYICNLDGYCGNTSSYYHEDLPNNMTSGGNCPSTQAFLGTIENNSWLAFEATTTSVSLDFTVSGCGTDGIQVGILQFNGTDWVRYSPCAQTDGANTGTFTVTGTGLTVGETYYLMMDGNAGANCDYQINVSGGTGVAIVDAGPDQTICGGSVNLTATGPVSAVYTWHSLDGVVTGATGANQTFNPAVTTTYVVEVTGGGVCENQTDTVVVTVNTGSIDAGTDGSVTFCNTDSPADLFAELGGTPDAGGSWSPALNSGTGVFTPGTDAANTYVYTVTGGCGSASANVVVAVDNGLPDTGVDGSADFCNTDPATDLINSVGGTPDAGGTWSPAMNSGTGVFTPGTDAANTYTYSITNACGTSNTDVVVAVDNGLPDTGGDASTTLCVGDPAVDLISVLTGSPDAGGIWSPAMNSGTGVFDPATDAANTYTYSITNFCGTSSSDVNVSVVTLPNAGANGTSTFCENGNSENLFDFLQGSPDGGGTWTPALNSGTGIFDPQTDAAGTYTYTINTSCGIATSTVEVTINPLPNPGVGGSLSICSTDPAEDLVNSLTGTPEAGGTWTPALASGSGVFDPVLDNPGTYTYTLTNSCGSASSTVEVSTTPAANAGTATTLNICEDATVFSLGDSLLGNPDSGGTWDPSLNSGSDLFDPSIDIAGTYVYTVTNSCGSATQELLINFTPLPNAGLNSTLIICPTGEAVDLLDVLDGSPEQGGFWSPVLSSGTNVFNPNSDPLTVYTYTVSNSCGNSTSELSITDDGADCDQHVYIPNIFSPNGNGENDILYVRGKGVSEMTFTIYNRWGQIIFQSNSLDNGWDGTFGGKPVNAGVFVYVLKGEFINGDSIDLKGNVTLVK